MTRNNDNTALASCVSAGDDFLTKPINPVILNFKLQALQRIRTMYDKLNEYQRNTEEELETSKHIFNAFINNVNHDVSNLSFWANSPGHFSGDTGLFKSLANGHVYVLLCDFTGHGLPAAIGTVFVADLFRSMTKKMLEAEVILDEINDKMNQILPTGRYCAAAMLDYDPAKAFLTVWNCGLPSAYLIDENNMILEEFPSAGVPLGVLKGKIQCEGVGLSVKHAKSIIMYSDGVTEAENPQGAMYTECRLQKCIENAKKDTDTFKEIKQSVEKFMDGMQPSDDISLIVLDLNQNSLEAIRE
ncbi:MAG TPA: response regulator [Gammaproteobacteria bacterium]|nr:response regulator [Gammaproteobacteria bacterium]